MILRAFALGLLVALASCARADSTTEVKMLAGPTAHRIVSLVPSMTEDLFAVGAGAQVVGVSEFSNYPREAKRLPVVASFASINAERIIALHPDLCLGIEAQDRLTGDLRRAGLAVVLTKDDSFEDIFNNLERVGDLSGHHDRALALVKKLRARTAALVSTVKPRSPKPRVFVVVGNAPIFTVGHGSYIEALINLAGGRNAATDVRQPYARYSAEALVARQPDLLVVDPNVRLGDTLNKPPWNALRAVKLHHVFTLPDAAILEIPGPRYNVGLAWLIDAIAKSAPTSARTIAKP